MTTPETPVTQAADTQSKESQKPAPFDYEASRKRERQSNITGFLLECASAISAAFLIFTAASNFKGTLESSGVITSPVMLAYHTVWMLGTAVAAHYQFKKAGQEMTTRQTEQICDAIRANPGNAPALLKPNSP